METSPLISEDWLSVVIGLFIFVLNGLLFWGVGNLLQGFQVAGFWPAVLATIVYSLISWLLSALILHSGGARTPPGAAAR